MTNSQPYSFTYKNEPYLYNLPDPVIKKIKDLERRLKIVSEAHFKTIGELADADGDDGELIELFEAIDTLPDD